MKRWIDRDHIFNPPNITKLEVLLTIEVKHTISRPYSKKFKPRRQRNGPVKVITINGGK